MHSIERIGKRFWYITPISETDRPILGMVVGKHKTLMIDAGNSEKHANYFLGELEKSEVPKPELVVLTHWHWDHIFGLSALKETISISSKKTKKEMEKLVHLSWSDDALDSRIKEGTEIEFCANAIKAEFHDERDITIVLPNLIFENKIEIDLGEVTCVIQHVGGDHAQDSVVVYIKEEKILFLGDCIYPDIYSVKRNYTINKTLQLLDQLETFDADIFILSHWQPISKEEFQQEVTMLRTIARFTAICNGDKQRVIEEYQKYIKRGLTEDELEVIKQFGDGYFDAI
jgi:glyoxylase-like metal-dependent hydrolase (beta-lactamase superfamily II)